MTRKRRQYTREKKLATLRRHLLESVAVSEICDEHGLQATVFHKGWKQLFEEGAVTVRSDDTEASFSSNGVTCRWKRSWRRRPKSWVNCWKYTSH